MSKDNPAKRAHLLNAKRRAYFAYLDTRIDELRKTGNYPGRLARTQADTDYAQAKRNGQSQAWSEED